MFELSPYYNDVMTQLLVFAMSFVSVFYGVQLTKYISKRVFNINPTKRKTTLPLEDYIAMPLIRKEVLSHDTVKFTFALPHPDEVLGLPTGQHVSLKYYYNNNNTNTNTTNTNTNTNEESKSNKEEDTTTMTAVQRSYTPVTDNTTTTLGEFSLVVKIYRPLVPKFPNGGKMSQHLDALQINDTILVHGPKGHMEYHGNGKITVKPLGKKVIEQRTSFHLCMMAGGTGITPMLQLLHSIFNTTSTAKNHIIDTKTQVRLIYANQTEDDILVRTELETLQANFPNRFSLWYTIDRLNNSNINDNDNDSDDDADSKITTTTTTTAKKQNWKYDVGFINETMIRDHLLFTNPDRTGGRSTNNTVVVTDTQFFMCGPPPMMKFACLPALQSLGYTEQDWIIF